jgi:hypothetical protein
MTIGTDGVDLSIRQGMDELQIPRLPRISCQGLCNR